MVTWDNFSKSDQTIHMIIMRLFKHEHLIKVQGGNDNDGNHILHMVNLAIGQLSVHIQWKRRKIFCQKVVPM